MSDTHCTRCGATFVSDGFTGGYAILADERKVCYPCADELQRIDMTTAQTYTVYLSSDGKRLTSWTGGELAHVIRETTDSGTDWHGTRLTHIRAVNREDGAEWYGRGSGRGMVLSIHRAKSRRA